MAKAVEKELPPLFKRHVRRPRLTQILDASIAQAILIIGPAGYGKTTLVAEWLQGRDAGVWYRATTASADVATFSAGVVEVIQPFFPGAGERILQRLRVPEAPDRLIRILAELLAVDIQDWPAEKWLIVDDYHLVAESAAVEEFVDWLLTLSPIRVVVTSRTRPAWASARRMLYGEITEVTREQLAMTPEEANLVISDVPQPSIRPLVAAAEGWPAVIGVAASAASIAVPARQLSDSLYRFMAEELLRRETPEAQNILLRSSVPPTLSQAYATALGIDLQKFGDVLERQVLVHRGAAGGSVLHPLLREFLQKELFQQDPNAFVDHHRAALAVAIDGNAWHEAFELAQQVSEHAAAEIIVRAAPMYLAQSRLETLEKWLAACDGAVSELPSASLVRAELLIRLERLSQAHAIAAEVADVLGDDHPLTARAWTLRGQASYWQAHDARALAEQRRAVRAVGNDDEDHRHALWYAFLSAQGLEREDAIEYLDALARSNKEAPTVSDRLRVAVGRVIARSRQGSLSGCSELFERASNGLSRETDPLVASSFLAHWAYVELSNARYDRARELARNASTNARTLRLTLPLHACLGYEALAELGNRRFRAADRIHAELSQLAAGVEDPHPSLVTAIVGLKIDLMRGHEPRGGLEPPPTTLPCQPSAIAEFKAIAALAASVSGGHDLAERNIAAGKESKNVETTLYALFTRVILADRRGEPVAGLLGEAIGEAERRACLDALVLAYRSCPRLLELVKGCTARTRLATERALALSRDEELAATYGFRVAKVDPINTLLTRRELEVLRLMADGLTNLEIAQALVISHSTAKVHVHHVVRKLGAKTRLQAVRRFENAELGGLD